MYKRYIPVHTDILYPHKGSANIDVYVQQVQC